MEPILITQNLCKRYGPKKAVNDVSMTVNRGDIYGFVGLNGGGKTTFIRLVTSLIKPTSGSFSLFGGTSKADRTKALSKISSMVETPSIYMNLSGADNLSVQCNIAGVNDAGAPKRLLELVGLDPKEKKTAKHFSLGMRQRLGIAMALVGNPEFMLLDEPTNGLDPEGIIEIRELLIKLNREMGITILVSSHILSELSKLATRYGFINEGTLIKEATLSEIEASVDKKIQLVTDNLPAAVKVLENKYNFTVNGAAIELFSDVPVSELVVMLAKENINVLSANKSTQDLEGYFMSLIGGKHNVGV